MKRIALIILALLYALPASAAILCSNANLTAPTLMASLEAARTSLSCIGTVSVTSSLTEAQSNISGTWPSNRVLKIEKGGKINNSTAFDISSSLCQLGFDAANIDTLRSIDIGNVTGFSISVNGYYEPGDGGGGPKRVWKALEPVSTYVDNGGSVIENGDGSKAWILEWSGPINVKWFGAKGDFVTDDSAAFISWANALGSDSVGLIPQSESGKAYVINLTVGFSGSNFSIISEGARFHTTSTILEPMFDLNKNALPNESVITHSIRWRGGYFSCSTSGNGGNANVAIRIRGITRGKLSGVRGDNFGKAMIVYNSRDAFNIEDVHGYQNNIHILIEDYQTTSNPQVYKISGCGFSVSYSAGVKVLGCANSITIENSYFTYSNAIVIEGGSTGYSGTNVNIDNCDFEQGSTGQYYIVIQDTNSRILSNLNITRNTFQASACKAIDLKRTYGVTIESNIFSQSEDGFISIDSNCREIKIGRNQYSAYATFTYGIAYACARKEITFDSSTRFRDPIAISGFTGGGISTSTGTVDMSASIGTYWTGEQGNKLIPPVAWLVTVKLRDSASSTTANVGVILKSAAGVSSNVSPAVICSGAPNDTWIVQDVLIPVDSSGDFYWDATASGAGTLDVYMTVKGWVH